MGPQRVLPLLICQHSDLQVPPREVPEVACHKAHIRMLFKKLLLRLQPERMRDVIPIHPRHQVGQTCGQPCVQRSNQAASPGRYESYPPVGGRGRGKDCRSGVGRTVVDGNQFPVSMGLGGKGGEGGGKEFLFVPDRKEYRYARNGHRGHGRMGMAFSHW